MHNNEVSTPTRCQQKALICHHRHCVMLLSCVFFSIGTFLFKPVSLTRVPEDHDFANHTQWYGEHNHTRLKKKTATLKTSSDYHNAFSKSSQDENHIIDSMTAPKPLPTLVHFDPYFMGKKHMHIDHESCGSRMTGFTDDDILLSSTGGFRNQHMRFVAFVAHAVKHNISQILLPSLQWMDHTTKETKITSLPHELLFDVPYWNSRAEEWELPTLVDYDVDVLEGVIVAPNYTINETEAMKVVPCWNVTSNLYSGLDETILRGPGFNPRRTDILGQIGREDPYINCLCTMGDNKLTKQLEEERASRVANNTSTIQHFTHLIAHGGAMTLWNEYSRLQKDRKTTINSKQFIGIYPEHWQVERAIYELLRPRQNIQLAIDDAIEGAMQKSTVIHNTNKMNVSSASPRLLALHPRVEQEMLLHRCNKHQESNLTRVFEMLRAFPLLHDATTANGYRFNLVFLAVSEEQVEQENIRNGTIGDVMNENRLALRHAMEYGLFGSDDPDSNSSRVAIPVFNSGIESAAKLQFPSNQPNGNTSADHTHYVSAEYLGVLELVASVINFFTAIKADIFVGVLGSTFSTDVFSIRYYQQKEKGGGENYILGPNGIKRLYGPAAPHSC